MPSVISFTTETDGRLPTGERRCAEAIEAVDAGDGQGAGLLHDQLRPSLRISRDALSGRRESGPVRVCEGYAPMRRKRSHAELDAAPDLDAGDPVELGSAICRARRPRRLGAPDRARRLLRHRFPPCRADLRVMRRCGGRRLALPPDKIAGCMEPFAGFAPFYAIGFCFDCWGRFWIK